MAFTPGSQREKAERSLRPKCQGRLEQESPASCPYGRLGAGALVSPVSAGNTSNLLRKPGLALQRLTTAEPTDDMMEVAIEAMNRVIPENENEDNW